MSDQTERSWWVFRAPHAIVYAPASTEQRARSVMARHAYDRAPVDAWPLIATRVTTRETLHRDLLQWAIA